MAPDLPANPLPGDQYVEICVTRQVERGVSANTARRVCSLLSTILPANGFDKQKSDMILFPAEFTREGVHNGRLKPWDAIKSAAPTLVGTPFFINMPGEHQAGVWPPTEDKTRWHGINVQVDIDEDGKRLTGIIGLFTPEAMKANGASDARIEFQKGFLKSLEIGGRFAISVAFGARIEATNGHYGKVPFEAIERKVIFNSTSLVPRGAEPKAILNGLDLKAISPGAMASNSADLAADDVLQPSPNESINAKPAKGQDSMPPTPEEQLASVNADLKSVRGELETHKQSVSDLKAQVNALTKEKTEQAATIDALTKEVNGYRQARKQAVEKRIAVAEKKLKGVYAANELSIFKDEKDLEATANRLEKLAEKTGSVTIVTPPEDPSVNEDDEEDESASEDSFEGLVNLRKGSGA